jgi:hypothetical protein
MSPQEYSANVSSSLKAEVVGSSEKLVKCKVHPRRRHEGPEGGYRYSSTIYLTSALDGSG